MRLLAVSLMVLATVPSPVAADIAGNPGTVHAITGARIVTAPGAEPLDGVLIVREGKIEAVGPDASIPPDARRHDRSGRIIYPGLIEPYLQLPPVAKDEARPADAHANPNVRADVRALERLPVSEETLAAMRESGFTTAFIVPADGIFRGAGVVIGLVDGEPENHVLVADAGQIHAFQHGGWESTTYPNSLQGAIALTRQSFLDAQWLRDARLSWKRDPTRAERPQANRSLDALLPVLDGEHPLFIACEDLRAAERAFRVAGEFGIRPVIVSGGSDEYREIDWFSDRIREAGASVVLTVNFPPVPHWEFADQKADIELDALVHWERAPTSPAVVADAGIPFAVSTQGLASPDSLLARLRHAIALGLSPDIAMAALTTEPARLFGLQDRLGTLERGKDASFLVASGALFAEGTRVVEVWINGLRHGEDPPRASVKDATRKWDLAIGRDPVRTTVRVELETDPTGALAGKVVPRAEATSDSTTDEDAKETPLTDVRFVRGRLSFTVPPHATDLGDAIGIEGEIRGDLVRGTARVGGDTLIALGTRAVRARGRFDEADSLLSPDAPHWPPLPDPDPPEAVLVRDATIWTGADAGRLENADLLVADGIIVEVGADLRAPSAARVIEAGGHHVTPGIIDCHSHSVIFRGQTNESTESATCEVRMRDVIDPWTINIYRELAGGVTMAHALHGSANVIGGQDAVVKYRWGAMADGLLFADAPPGVKFALGENVKQSNWGEKYTTRYPQTRMGVEQFLRDRFLAAIDHRERMRAWEDEGEGTRPRVDLELEALLEILDGTRLIHCHAYRADEMLVLMRVMEEFDVRVATFDHVLEGYKIADELARHGVGGTAFSDWWAYKFEVYDAIPYAGHIMWEREVVVSYNSDSRELARRLNLEAAKAVKYGRVPEEEALKFVSLNAAIQLGVDRWVGSLEAGKQGDFVIWSDHPLSDGAICLETWIDGRRYFSREADTLAREAADALRRKLLAKAERWGATRGGTPTFARTFASPSRDGADFDVVQGVGLEAIRVSADEEGRP